MKAATIAFVIVTLGLVFAIALARKNYREGKAKADLANAQAALRAQSQSKPMAHKIRKSEWAGVGAGIQFFGILLIVFAFIVPVAIGLLLGLTGIVLLIVGSFKARVVLCSECRGKVEQEAKICRHCRTEFS